MPVQPVLEKAGGLSAPRLRYPAAGKSPDTVCGWVRNIGREGQQHRLLTLARLRDEQVDMFTTVFIGAGTTQAVAGRMVTPRGYEAKR